MDSCVSKPADGGRGRARTRAGDFRELMEDEWVIQRGLSITREHDGPGPVTTISAVAQALSHARRARAMSSSWSRRRCGKHSRRHPAVSR